MIKKIKATLFEKLILLLLILLGIFALSFTILIKNKCLFVKNYDPQKINFNNPKNIAILNTECGNVIIELYPKLSPNAVIRFKTLVNSNAYDDVAFHRVIKDKLVQAGDIEFGKQDKLDYEKIGTGESGLGIIKSEIDALKIFLITSFPRSCACISFKAPLNEPIAVRKAEVITILFSFMLIISIT